MEAYEQKQELIKQKERQKEAERKAKVKESSYGVSQHQVSEQ